MLYGWIEACLRYGGEFGPADKITYQAVFGVSEGTVSRHQAEFEHLFEAVCGTVFERDTNDRVKGGRLTVAEGGRFPEEPVFAKMPSLHRWLQETLDRSRYVELPSLRRDPPHWIMRLVIKSIRRKTPLRITYHSRSGSKERVVSAHALVRIVGRTHMRAFDHGKNQYGDFVLSRITNAILVPNAGQYIGPEHDDAWNSVQQIDVQEKDSAEEGIERTGVRLDFGLDDQGRRAERVKKALVQYMIDDMMEGYNPPVRISTPRLPGTKP